MQKSKDIRAGSHVVFSLYAHVVFVTKYRRKVLNAQILNFMQPLFTDICRNYEVQLCEFEGEADHVHLLINYPPKLCLSKLIQH